MPAGAAAARPYSRAAVGLLWVALALLWFLPLNTPHLFNPDEGRYAEIPREMVVSGDWVTPRLDAIKYFEKPPLQYWATAVAYQAAGQHAWTVRLWTALCGFLGLGLTFALGRRLFGGRAALFALIVQAGALLYCALARIATLDMGLCFTLQLAMTALALLVHRPAAAPTPARAGAPPGAPPWFAALLLGVGVALAMLAKGLVGILIPAAVAVLFMLIYRDARLLLTSRPWWTVAALAVLAAPWFVLVSLRNPSFAHFFFIFEHFQRYLSTAGFDRYHPVWYFIPVLVAGMMPWTTLLPRTLAGAARAAVAGERATGLLLIWAAFVFVFFSLSHSKLLPYVLPAVPALSLLIGRELARLRPRQLALHLLAVALAMLLITAALLLAWRLPVMAAQVAAAGSATIIGIIVAFALLTVGAALGALCCRRGHMLCGAAAAALGMLLFAQAALLAVDQLPRIRATATLTQQLRPWIGNYRHFYCVNQYLQTLPFDLQRTCTPVAYRGELDFGLTLEPWRGIPTLPDFVTTWREQTSALAIMRPRDYLRLQALGAPMHVIYTAPSYVAVVRQ
jgi:4-amino-4-deoxy-L-arabinose transferase-like glycosyltransferase